MWIWSCLIPPWPPLSDSLLTGFAKLDSERSPVKARVVIIFYEFNIEGKEVANDAVLKKRQECEE